MDDDDEWDEDVLANIDNLVAQHQAKQAQASDLRTKHTNSS